MKLQIDLREFIELLNSHNVDYVLVGGHAVAYHGYPRLTGDIEFFVRSSQENGQRILSVLKDFGFTNIQIDASDFTLPNKVIQFGRPPNRIDLITSISGVEFEIAWQNRIQGTLDGLHVNVLGRDELLKNKRASGRAKDLADLEVLAPEDT